MNEDNVASLRQPLEDEKGQNGTVGGSDKEKTEVKPGVFDTRAKKATMLCLSLYWFVICCAYAMIAPFFPGEVSHSALFQVFCVSQEST